MDNAIARHFENEELTDYLDSFTNGDLLQRHMREFVIKAYVPFFKYLVKSVKKGNRPLSVIADTVMYLFEESKDVYRAEQIIVLLVKSISNYVLTYADAIKMVESNVDESEVNNLGAVLIALKVAFGGNYDLHDTFIMKCCILALKERLVASL